MKDFSYLKEKPITILGGGALAKTCAVDCKLGGHKEVRMCDIPPFSETSFIGIDKGIELYAKNGKQFNRYGFLRAGRTKIDMITDDVGEAMKGAGIVVITTPAFGHIPFFEKMIPYLEDNMIIHVMPDNYGTLILRKMMKEAGCNKDVIIGGWHSAPYGTRLDIDGSLPQPRVGVEYRAVTLRGAAFPAVDTDDFIESSKYFPCMDSVFEGDGPQKAVNALDTCFSNGNAHLHCPSTILGVGAMENWARIYGFKMKDFSVYSHVFCESISRVTYEFYMESVRIMKEMGMDMIAYKKQDFFNRKSIIPYEFWGDMSFTIPFDELDYGALGTGPVNIKTRYITEDIPVGTKMYHEFGKLVGIPTPVTDALITLASVMVEKDYFAEGYNLKTIGVDGMKIDQIKEYLHTGIMQ